MKRRRGLRGALAVAASLAVCSLAPAGANTIERIRFGVGADTTRVVFDLTERADYVAAIDPADPSRLTIIVNHLDAEAEAALHAAPIGFVSAVAETAPGVFALTLSAPARIQSAFVLAPSGRVPSYRLVIDLERLPADAYAQGEPLADAPSVRFADTSPVNGGGIALQPAAGGSSPASGGGGPRRPARVGGGCGGGADAPQGEPCADAVATGADAKPTLFFSEDGLSIPLGATGAELNLGGRVHADAAAYSDSATPMDDDVALRRARLALSIKGGERFRLKVERDFSTASKGWKNVWGSYEIADRLRIKAGSQMAPFSMENLASSNAIAFMERSLASALAPDFLTGLAAVKYGRHYSVTGGYFRNALSTDSDAVVDDGRSFIVRATAAPVNRPGAVVHIGLAAERRDIRDDAMSRVRAKPEMAIGARRLIDTRMMTDVEAYTSLGAELGAQFHALNFQAQYIHRETDADGLGDPSFDGAYAQVSWAITGEARGYSESSGVFTDIRPRRRAGAVEAAARISMLDLSDGLVAGGEETNYSLGLNWYVTDNARLMLNLIRARARPGRNGEDEAVNIAGFRTQVDF